MVRICIDLEWPVDYAILAFYSLTTQLLCKRFGFSYPCAFPRFVDCVNPQWRKESVMLHRVRLPLVAALCVAVVLTLIFFASTWQGSTAATNAEIGVAPVGQNSMEFVGIVDQNGPQFTYYGYVTYLAGITSTLLFRDPISHTEATARITFHGTSAMTGRSIVNNLFNLNAAGTITFYYDENQGADFNNPDSFTRGTAIASATTRFHNVLVVTAPNTGIANGEAELLQTTATSFDLAGQSYQLGRSGLQHRFTYNGFGTRLEPATPRAVIVIAANGQVTGQPTFLPQVENGTP
jgi:hypothetical protein